MLNTELLIIVTARGFLGLFLAAILGFGSWSVIRDSIQTPNSDSALFFLAQAAMAGGGAGMGAAVAWWNTQSSRRVHWLSALLTVAAAVVVTWLVLEIWGVYTYHALFGGVYRVPVISTSDMLTKMVTAAVLSANAAAAALYMYRALRHREV